MNYSIIFSTLFLISSVGFSQQNPFRAPATVKDSVVDYSRIKPLKMPMQSKSGLWKLIPFSRELLSGQRFLIGKLSSALRAIKAHPHPSTVAVLLLFAFLYGIIHSIGPGHAKTLFISHGLSRASPFRATWIAGAIFSLTHTGSAVILFMVFRILLGLGQKERDAFSHDMIVVSGILIIIAGIIIIISSLLEKKAHSAASRLLKRSTELIPVAIIAGLAPCPGAFLILTFSSVIQILPIGIAAVAAVSLGMAVTVSFAGMAGSSIGKTVSSRDNHPLWSTAATVIRYFAAVIIIAIGLLMLIG